MNQYLICEASYNNGFDDGYAAASERLKQKWHSSDDIKDLELYKKVLVAYRNPGQDDWGYNIGWITSDNIWEVDFSNLEGAEIRWSYFIAVDETVSNHK